MFMSACLSWPLREHVLPNLPHVRTHILHVYASLLVLLTNLGMSRQLREHLHLEALHVGISPSMFGHWSSKMTIFIDMSTHRMEQILSGVRHVRISNSLSSLTNLSTQLSKPQINKTKFWTPNEPIWKPNNWFKLTRQWTYTSTYKILVILQILKSRKIMKTLMIVWVFFAWVYLETSVFGVWLTFIS